MRKTAGLLFLVLAVLVLAGCTNNPNTPPVPPVEPDENTTPDLNVPAVVPDACSSDSNCNDNLPCTLDACAGTPKACVHSAITACQNGDSCCTSDCSFLNDNDCASPAPDQCQTDANCNDSNYQTWDSCTGTPKQCVNNPPTCSQLGGADCATDKICSIALTTAFGTTRCCMGLCTYDQCIGVSCDSNHTCSSGVCVFKTCTGLSGNICAADQNCANAFISTSDSTRCCASACGNANQCTTAGDCGDVNACTTDVCSGTPKICSHSTVSACTNGDGCCAGGCSYTTDNDCSPPSPETGTQAFCESLSTTAQKQVCYSDFSIQNTYPGVCGSYAGDYNSLCLNMINGNCANAASTALKDNCYFKKAVRTSTAATCSSISDATYTTSCQSAVALAPQSCNSLYIDMCHYERALKDLNSTQCNDTNTLAANAFLPGVCHGILGS